MIDALLTLAQATPAPVDHSVLVAIIGAPAALITSIATVWLIARRAVPPSTTPVSPVTAVQQSYEGQPRLPEGEPRTNGYRYVTHGELKEIIRDIKQEMRDMEGRQNDKFDLIVALLKDRR
jgi:hypothetical protein